MRNKSQEREFVHKPPSNISADGMDSWYMQQRKREQELRLRRKEAEALLRGYRGYGFSTPTSQGSENLDDPSVVSHTNGFFGSPPIRPISTRSDDGKRLPPRQFDKSPARTAPRNGDVAEEKKDGDEVKPEQEKEPVTQDAAVPMTKNQAPAPLIIPSLEPYVPETLWRDFVSSMPGAKFPAEAGRYHLYVSNACPGSHRALIIRALKGLEDIISVTYVHPTWRLTNPNNNDDKHRGW